MKREQNAKLKEHKAQKRKLARPITKCFRSNNKMTFHKKINIFSVYVDANDSENR